MPGECHRHRKQGAQKPQAHKALKAWSRRPKTGVRSRVEEEANAKLESMRRQIITGFIGHQED